MVVSGVGQSPAEGRCYRDGKGPGLDERQVWVWDLAHPWAFPTQGHIRDITDSLIERCQDKRLDENANIQVSDEKIVNVVMDLFGAGMSYPVVPFLFPAVLTRQPPNFALYSPLARV